MRQKLIVIGAGMAMAGCREALVERRRTDITLINGELRGN
jgi:glutamyl-tRNA reductase